MSEEKPPEEEQTFKAFQFGGNEPVVLSDEDANIGDAINSFNGLTEARRTVRLPENEGFVSALEEALRDGEEHLRRAIALSALQGAMQALIEALERASEDEDREALEQSAIVEEKEDGTFAAKSAEVEERLEAYAEEPPTFFKEAAADVLDGEIPWEAWAEWSATHVLYWAAEDVKKEFREEGRDPDAVDDEEWDRRFNNQLSVEEYFADAVQIVGGEIADTITRSMQKAAQNEELSLVDVETLLGLHEDEPDAPPPRPETEEMDPEPFTGGAAELLSDVFTSKATRALMDADGDPAPTYKGEWGQDSTGHPIRVEQLGNPYEGRATFRVQAFGEPDPAAVEASMGWKMLNRMDMDTVWLNLLLLSYASATHRRGERPIIRIGRRTVEKVFGYRNGNYTMKERAQKIRRHVEALQSIFVQFQNVRRHGDKLHFKGDMAGGAPLWNLRMVAEGEKDLFTGQTVADWHLEAREGLWATEFLHNHGDQFTPLPKEWFKEIDRRGSRNYAQRLAAYLLFQFRINAKNGARVKRRAATLLEVCGEDMDKPRDTRRRSELKRCLSKALDTLDRDYGIEVHAERVHMDHTSGMSFDTWKNRTAEFAPPASVEGRIFKTERGKSPPLPDVAGDWEPKQIRHLRTEVIGETQPEFGARMDVSKQYISQLERGTSEPSTRVRKRLDALHSRFG